MACDLVFLLSIIIIFSSSNYHPTTTLAVFLEESHIISPTDQRTERFTQLHFYFHDVQETDEGAGRRTTVRLSEPLDESAVHHGFGVTLMADSPLTEGPDPSSKLVGRAQGTYALASQTGLGFKVVMNFVFTQGVYKGSTLSILGRYAIEEPVREISIVGGSGFFRLARGYALATTFSADLTTGNSIVEYNVSVYHF